MEQWGSLNLAFYGGQLILPQKKIGNPGDQFSLVRKCADRLPTKIEIAMGQAISLQGQSGEVVLFLLRQAQKPSRLSQGVAITFRGDPLVGQKCATDLSLIH